MKHALMLICALLMIAGFALIATAASDAALTPALAHLARMGAMVSMMRGSLAATCGVAAYHARPVRALPRSHGRSSRAQFDQFGQWLKPLLEHVGVHLIDARVSEIHSAFRS